MFCMNCGTPLPDGTRFCPECGTKVDGSDVQEQTVQTSQPSVQLSKPEQLSSGASSAGQPLEMPGMAQTAQDIQPMRYSAEIPPMPPVQQEQPAKKKSRLVPGLCIAAGAVVVLGGAGAAFCHFNKPLVSKLIMGDAGYAHSITMNTLSGVSEQAGVVSTLAQQSVSAGITAAQAGASSADDIVGSLNDGLVNSTIDDGKITSTFNMSPVGAALENAAWQVNHITGTRGVTTSFGVKASAEQGFIDTVKADIGVLGTEAEVLENLLRDLDLGMTLSEKDSGSALEYAAGLTANGESIGSAQLRYEADGTGTLILPGMSDIGFTFKLPAHSLEEAGAVQTSLDINKLYGNISNNLKETFKGFEIKCQNGTTELGTLKFSGMTVQMKLDKDDICDIALVVVETARDDEGLTAYIKALDSSITDEDISEGYADMISSIEDFRSGSSEAGAEITYYMNGDNTLAGADITVNGDDDNTAAIRYLTSGNDCEVAITECGKTLLEAHIKGESATSGRAEISCIKENYVTYSFDMDEEQTAETKYYTFTVDYKDIATANVFGLPVTTGSYSMTFPAENVKDYLSDLDIFSDGVVELAGDTTITVDVAQKGKGAEYTVGMSTAGIGRLSYSVGIDEETGDVAPKPGSEYRFIKIDDTENAYEAETDKLQSDIMEYYSALSERNTFIKAVYTALALLDSSSSYPDAYDDYVYYDDAEDDFTASDWAQDEDIDAQIVSANTAALEMKQQTTVFITKMDAAGKPLSGDSFDVLCFVDDGEWGCYVDNLNSDVDPYDFATYSGWSDGVDHWGSIWFAFDEVTPASDKETFMKYVSETMPDISEGMFDIQIDGGRVLGVSYIPEGLPIFPDRNAFETGRWDFAGSGQAGICEGCVIGTAPMLVYDSEAHNSGWDEYTGMASGYEE